MVTVSRAKGIDGDSRSGLDEGRHLREIAAAIAALIADVAGVDAATLDESTGMDDLGIDSLLIVEVVVGIQRQFGVAVPPSAFRADIRTVGAVCQTLSLFVAASLAEDESAAGGLAEAKL